METEEISTLPTESENKVQRQSNTAKTTSEASESMEVETNGNTTSKHVHFHNNVNIIDTQEKMTQEKVLEVEELTQMADSQKWVHMNNVEKEKLEWMKDCPAPSAVKMEVKIC